jgi:anti-sigma28 factor (negative regulator of flagellin synthesis)
MGVVQGIGPKGLGVSSPAGGQIEIQQSTPAFVPSDGVVISKAAAKVAAARQASLDAQSAALREQQIQEIQQRLQDGAYKLQAALLQVASRVLPRVE